MITIKDLSFSYEKKLIFQNMNITFESPNIYGVVGPNGIGKTTFFKLLLKILKTNNGHIFLDELTLEKIDQSKIPCNISYLPQDYPVPQGLTIGEFYKFFFKSKVEIERSLQLLNKFQMNFSPSSDFLLSELSGGERKVLLLSRVLAIDVPIYLLDEPISNIDPKKKSFFVEALNEFYKSNKKLIMLISHDLDILKECSTQISYLSSNKISHILKNDFFDRKEMFF